MSKKKKHHVMDRDLEDRSKYTGSGKLKAGFTQQRRDLRVFVPRGR